MSSLRPQHRRGNGAVGVTLMRSANQFNNARRLGTNAQGKDGTWKPRGKPNDAKRMRLPRVERRRMHALTREGNEHVSRESRRSNRSIVREPHALRRHPSPRLAPHLARNTQRNTQEWQDSRVVHDSGGSVQRKDPLRGKIFARCIPER